MNKISISAFLAVLTTCFIIISGCKNTAAPLVPVKGPLLESNSMVNCEPTPFNSGNAQIITAGSSYTITETDIYLESYYYPDTLSGSVWAAIQGVTVGVDFLGNTLDVPDGVTLTGGVSTNVFDASTLTNMSGHDCNKAALYFSGCAITAGQKYSLVIFGDVPLTKMGINNDLTNPISGQPFDFVFKSSGQPAWQYAKRIEYYIY